MVISNCHDWFLHLDCFPRWHFVEHWTDRLRQGHRAVSQEVIHLHAVVDRKFVYSWQAWMIDIDGKELGSIWRSEADKVSFKSTKSDAMNVAVITPVAVLNLYFIQSVVLPATRSIILQGSIDGAVLDRSTLAIFKPTISPTSKSFNLFKFRWKMPFWRSVKQTTKH